MPRIDNGGDMVCNLEDGTVFNIAQDTDSERTQNITIDMNIAKDAFPVL